MVTYSEFKQPVVCKTPTSRSHLTKWSFYVIMFNISKINHKLSKFLSYLF